MRYLFVVLISFWGLGADAKTSANLNRAGVILEGYDAVSYFKSDKPQKGDAKIQTKYEGSIYFFSSEENKEVFLKDPKKYVPQFDGWCAYAVADSKEKVEADPKSFVIQNGRLLLFYNGFWGDTRDKWLHTKNKSVENFLLEADRNWPEVQKKEP